MSRSAGDLFYREQEAPTSQKTHHPGEDYTEDEDQGMPPGNPGFRNLPPRDEMDPSSAKVIPDSMKTTLEQNYHKASASRVAAPFIAALLCNPLATSAAWIDPKGKVYEIPGRQTHDQWAASYLSKDKGFQESARSAWTWLVDRGWVRFVNFLNIEVGPRGAPHPAMEAAAELVVNCALSRRDVEPEDLITFGVGIRTQRPTIGDFVAEWGSRKTEERLYEGLFSRGSGIKTEALVGDIMSRWARTRTAATIDEILGNTGPKVMQRAGKVKLTPRRFAPDKGFWTFTAQGSSGNTHVVRIKGVRKGNVVNMSKAQIKCSCSCEFWRWQGPEHWADRNGYLYRSRRVPPQGTMSTPRIRDPQGKHWVCKHMAAALQKARSFRFAGEGGDWSFEGEVVLEPSAAWVASRYASSKRMVFRPEGWEALGREAYKEMDSWVNPSKIVWRGMDEQEYMATIGAGRPLKSRGDWSHSSEGTNFAREPHDAESYMNFGRTDPRKTGRPNYLVGVRRLPSMKQWSDGYIKTPEPVELRDVLVIWKVVPEGDALVGRKIRG